MQKSDGRHTVEFTVHGRENNVLTMVNEPTMLHKLPKLLFTYILQEQQYKLWPWLVELLEGRPENF
jgi:hypothetical protein